MFPLCLMYFTFDEKILVQWRIQDFSEGEPTPRTGVLQKWKKLNREGSGTSPLPSRSWRGGGPKRSLDSPLLSVMSFIAVFLLLTGYCTTKLGIQIFCTHKIRFPFITYLWLIIAITPRSRSDYTDYTCIRYKYVMQWTLWFETEICQDYPNIISLEQG